MGLTGPPAPTRNRTSPSFPSVPRLKDRWHWPCRDRLGITVRAFSILEFGRGEFSIVAAGQDFHRESFGADGPQPKKNNRALNRSHGGRG
jgi:hypothetical protein